MTTKYTVTAKQWDRGWELHIDGVGVTQAKTLAAAPKAVRDYVSLMHDTNEDDAAVTIYPELGAVADTLNRMRERAARIEEEKSEYDRDRSYIMKTMKASGFSYSDIAATVGLTKGRVGQLIG